MNKQCIGLLGATSFVGKWLLPLLSLEGLRVVAFSRRPKENTYGDTEWRQIDPGPLSKKNCKNGAAIWPADGERIPYWVCAIPTWAVPDYFDSLEAYGARRVVVLSSTSRFTKNDSSDLREQTFTNRLIDSEARIQTWAEKNGIEWVILRPTLIYGGGLDKNVAAIARFAHRSGFFPLLGKATGLRQPIHAEDVAGACVAALNSPEAADRAYNISGSETLAYHEMVRRVFVALHRQPRMIPIPLAAFRFALFFLRFLPKYRPWSAAMAERMNRDLVFDHSDAVRDLGFSPRPFRLTPEDVSG